jgi:hypothetical protein
MSQMIEIYYRKPADAEREREIQNSVREFGGQITYREDDVPYGICLTIEFCDRASAELACNRLRDRGEHVEGPMQYGDD